MRGLKRCRAARGLRGVLAFSLPEVLAAGALMLAVALVSFQLFSSAMQLWRQSGERMDTIREGRAAEGLIRRDLSAALVPTNGSPTLWLQRLSPEEETGSSVQDQLYLLMLSPHSGAGDLCAVGYYVVWSEAERGYLLMRRFLDNATVHQAFQAQNGEIDLGALFANGAGVEEVAARYVWDFKVRPGDGSVAADAYPHTAYAEALPEWVSVEFKTLGPMVARKLKTLPISRGTWSDSGSGEYQQWIAPYQEEVRTRVLLMGAARK